MPTTGVYPVFENKFKIGINGRSSADPDGMKTIADLETFSVAIDGNIEEWNPMESEGWTRRMVTGKSLTITLSGKRHIVSMRSSSCRVKPGLRSAFRLSSNCATELAPTMTDVTFSFASTHASAISANVCPRSVATSFSALIFAATASVSVSRFRKRPWAMRESSGTPCR